MKIKNRESIWFTSPADMPYLQAVRGANVTNEFTRHAHHRFCMGIVQRGARIILQRGVSALVPENAVFAVNAGMPHTCKPQGENGHDYLAICVDVEKMKGIAAQISEKAQAAPYIGSVVLFDAELASRMYELFFLLGHAGSILQRESSFVSMLSGLVMRHGDRPAVPCRVGSQQRAIDRVCEFIGAHFADNLSLEDLSRVACLSPFHFQRLFLKSAGVSPHEYLIQARVKKAAGLLIEGHSIAGTAIDTGFADQSHFSRSFKRIMGITPGRYLLLHGN
jgi:AraC-like DNA-binding protein